MRTLLPRLRSDAAALDAQLDGRAQDVLRIATFLQPSQNVIASRWVFGRSDKRQYCGQCLFDPDVTARTADDGQSPRRTVIAEFLLPNIHIATIGGEETRRGGVIIFAHQTPLDVGPIA